MLDRDSMRSAFEGIAQLRSELLDIREGVDERHPRYHSLLNLKHYLRLRHKTRTELQERLFLLSLSSLGRSYAHVGASIDTLYDQLSSSLHCEELSAEQMFESHHLPIQEAIKTASRNAKALFGGKTSSRLSRQSTSVMVTLPSHAPQHDGHLIRGLAKAGVNVFRINTAHDSLETWKQMADVIKDINSTREEKEQIKVFVDLAGPKIRTGRIQRLERPVVMGSNKRRKEILITTGDAALTRPERTDPVSLAKLPAEIAVDKHFFKHIKSGKFVKLTDANGKKVSIDIVERNASHAIGMIEKKAYIDRKTTLQRRHHEGEIRSIEHQPDQIRLSIGDHLIITEQEVLGRSARLDKHAQVVGPAMISCTLQGLASLVKIGDQVFIDDGKIGLVVMAKGEDSLTCEVTQAKVNGTLLKEEKGINLPDTHIKISALTKRDRKNLVAVSGFADHLSVSFCQNATDIRDIQELLAENDRSDIGIIAKIETKKAVSNMPEILEQLLGWEKSGVMIARGDLAIEVGFKNLAHVQEALLDICDAAHMPVIWATQVLESQMKDNLPSRAEITDAAMSGRADCVMLNKGAFAMDTIDVLRYILHDMHSIFKKNRQLLKREALWR